MSDITRTTRAYPKDKLRTHLIRLINEGTSIAFPFQFGQVVEVDDKARIRVRVPLLDDVLEDNELPWCLCMHNRVIDTPEVNSAVIIGIWNPEKPTVRFWFTAVTNEIFKDLFGEDALEEELDDNQQIWKNISKLTEKTYGHFPGDKNRPYIKSKSKKINYKVGLRGKGKNSLLFERRTTTLIQNKGMRSESKLILSDKAELIARNIDILSPNSRLEHRPVFADPLFFYMQQQLLLLTTIVTVLSTVPALFFGIPCVPSPAAAPLPGMLSNLATLFGKLKIDGKSTNIKIN